MSYALITGASKGIGKKIAEELAAKKVDLLLVARTETLLKELADDLSKRYQIKTAYLVIDLSVPSSPTAIIDWVNKNGFGVSILVYPINN